MAENFNIKNEKQNENNDKNKVQLSDKQRDTFKNEFNQKMEEFDLINSLIEEHLEETDATTDKDKEEDPLEIKQSYSDTAKLQRERLQRIGLLKSDPTGKNLKASGEDI